VGAVNCSPRDDEFPNEKVNRMEERSQVLAALNETEREIACIVEGTSIQVVLTGWSRGHPAFPDSAMCRRLGMDPDANLRQCGTTVELDGMRYAALVSTCDVWQQCNSAGAAFFRSVNSLTRPSERDAFAAWSAWSLITRVLAPHSAREDKKFGGMPHLFESYNLWSLYVALAATRSIKGMPGVKLLVLDGERPAVYDAKTHDVFFTTVVDLATLQLAAVRALRAPWDVVTAGLHRPHGVAVQTQDTVVSENTQPPDPSAYVAARDILAHHCSGVPVRTHKQLQSVLKHHPEIKHWKPNRQRLCVHLVDWTKYAAETRAKQVGQSQPEGPLEKPRNAALRPDTRPVAAAGRTQERWRCKKCSHTTRLGRGQAFECPKCSSDEGEPVVGPG